MKANNNILKTFGLGLAICSLAALNASAIVNYAFDPNGVDGLGLNQSTANPGTYGATVTDIFTTRQPVDLTSLGVFEASPLVGNVTVSIYLSTLTGTLSGSPLVTETFNSANTGILSGDFGYINTSYNLAAGTTYALVATYAANGNSLYYNGGSGDITVYSGSALAFGNAYLTSGKHQNTSPVDPSAIGGGSFGFTPVPEARTFAVAGVGMLGLVFIGRKAMLRRTA